MALVFFNDSSLESTKIFNITEVFNVYGNMRYANKLPIIKYSYQIQCGDRWFPSGLFDTQQEAISHRETFISSIPPIVVGESFDSSFDLSFN